MMEATGSEEQIESLAGMMRPFGIRELVRTGPIAMVRGSGISTNQGNCQVDRAGMLGRRQTRLK